MNSGHPDMGYPTVEALIVFKERSVKKATERVLRSLSSLVPLESWTSLTTLVYAPAPVGDIRLPLRVVPHKVAGTTQVSLCFDEDEIVLLARRTGISITDLLSPYVLILQSVEGCLVVGLGFDMDPLKSLDDRAAQEASIAILFRREESGEWTRKEFLPMVGHYL